MGNPYELRLAGEMDQDHILGLITGAATWLAGKDTDQWQEPWPDRRTRDARVLAAICAGKTWILMDGDVPAGTITAEWRSEPAPGLPELWVGYPAPAVYVHRVVVSREVRYRGRAIGRQMIDAMSRLGEKAYGAKYLRLDAWTTNDELHEYYGRLGFEKVGTHDRDAIGDCPSGALFQRPVEKNRISPTAFRVNPDDALLWRACAGGGRLHRRVRNRRNRTLTMEVAGSGMGPE